MAQGDDRGTNSMRSRGVRAFRSGRVITPEGLREAAIMVEAGRIVDVVAWDGVPEAAQLIDFGEAVLLPGLVDSHVHINDAGDALDGCALEPGRAHWEGFRTGTQAAAAGGVTTLVDMPLNCVPETLNAAALRAKRAAARGNVWVDWMSWGGVVGNGGVAGNEGELEALAEAGVPGFKCFLVNSGIDGFAWTDEAQLRKSLAVLRGLGLPLLVHAELAGPIDRATAALGDADWRRYRTYLDSRPDEAEVEAVELLVRLAREFDARLHIVHVASARMLPILKQARAAGLKITAETCPQYLWFTAEEIADGGTEFKCAPPIRKAGNREALWQGLREGVLDMIATDHSPCPAEMKGRDEGRFDRAWGGVASLGLALPVIWTGLQERGGELELLAKWMATEPARLAGVAEQKGALAAGMDADMVIFDPDADWVVTEDDLLFRHKVSPYVGVRLRGRVIETYLRGERIFQRCDGVNVVSSEPRGRELRLPA